MTQLAGKLNRSVVQTVARIIGILTGLFAGGGTVMGQEGSEDREVASAFREWLEEECKRHPVFASQLGNRAYDGMMDDLSPSARAADLRHDEQTLSSLTNRFQGKNLSRNALIDLEIWRHYLQYRLWQAKQIDEFATDPRVYLAYSSDSIYGLFTQSTLPKHRNIENAVSRMGGIPKVIEAAKASLTSPPKVLTEIAIKRTEGAISFYEREIFTMADESPQVSSLAPPARKAAEALRDYKRFLEEKVLPRSTSDWRIGKEKFSQKLAMELDAGMSAQEVIEAAEREAVRVEAEMYYVSKQLWSRLFPDQALPPDDEEGRRETIRSVLKELGKSHGTEETLVEDARGTVERIKQFISEKKILTLPAPDQCDIILMPEFQRGYSVAYLNPAPPLDPMAKSLYAIAPPPAEWPDERKEAYLQEYNSAMLQILTIHEAYPGHYVQLDYSNRSDSLVRKVLYSGVFAEGWAVYTEQMMLDQGYGEGDLSLRLHQLKFYIRAVLNAILDYRMHCTEMTDEEALSLLVDRGFQTTGEAIGKIQRAKQSSCQLSTYFVGRMAFYNLRKKVQRARGDRFELGKYHEEVLSHGTLPVKYLPELIK